MIAVRFPGFEIGAKLGEGGMGEVYRATDSRLKREVAIKVLPPSFTADRERVARFEREAQVLAQLHHPNIASIFGLEEAEGTLALVMELVEGDDLSARIARGALPVEEALAIARQIAEALEAAHERGIVHRDLKPQNVKVRPDGTVKVLDFGLAKAMDASSPSSGNPSASPTLMNSPTITAAGTQLGVILGTAAYMSPEQARGAAVDERADIWAFGVVLFEMLTGRSLFAADTVTDTLAGVLKTEIDPGKLPAATPAEVRRLLRRCLERNPKNRLHDIADARIVLDEVQRGVEADASPASASVAPSRSRKAAILAAAAGALALGLAAGWALHRTAPAPVAGDRWALAIPPGYTLSHEQAPQLSISADGRLQASVVTDTAGVSQILLRSSGELEPRVLPDTNGASAPFFSPDGAWVGFFRGGVLSKVAVAGGPPIQLTPTATNTAVRGASWSRDGFVYFAPNVNVGLSRVSENGGPLTEVTKLDLARDERTHRWPQVLPDGSAVIFTCDTSTSTEYYDDARIEAVRVKTGERKVLVEGASEAHYAGGGKLVFARGGSLFAVSFDPQALTVTGAPELVVQGVATDVSSGAVQFALAESGAAIWEPGGASADLQLVWMTTDGKETPAAVPAAAYNESALSPDGTKVALVGGQGGAADLWIADLVRGGQLRLTTGQAVRNPVWTPDGRAVAYGVRARATGPTPHFRIALRAADGSREEETLLDTNAVLSPSAFTPDGQKLLYSSSTAGDTFGQLYVLPMAAPRQPMSLLLDSSNKRDPVVSPDGRWLAYSSNEGGTAAVYVRPYPTGEGRWQISTGIGLEPKWAPDQSALYFRDASSVFWRASIDTRSGFTAGKPERLFDRVSPAGIVHTYGLARDGRIFTPRAPQALGDERIVYIDLGFEQRVEKLGKRGVTP